MTLGLVALVFLGPFALAVLLYYGPAGLSWLPRLPGSRELIEPPLPTPAGWLPGAGGPPYRWSLIYAKMPPCEEPCARDLGRMVQVRRALGRDVDRVAPVFLYAGDTPPPAPAGAEVVTRRLEGEVGTALTAAIGAERLRAGSILIGDPAGKLIASYPADVEQKELLRDLKRLLSVSGTD